MIYAECYIIDLRTNKPASYFLKKFDSQGDFNAWYKSTKDDMDFVINIMRYNPKELTLQKAYYDAILLSVKRGCAQ